MSGRDEVDVARARLLDRALLQRGDDVLDLGDDAGFLAADVRARIGDGAVYAVAGDVGVIEELLRRAHELDVAGVTYLVGDADVLPLPDGSVDAAVGRGPFAGARDARVAARELYRVLRGGGRLSLAGAGDGEDAAAALRDAGFVDVAVAFAEADVPVMLTARKP